MNDFNNIPECVTEYWNLIKFMERTPGLYGLDNRRETLHDAICEHFKVSKNITLAITNRLDIFDTVLEFYEAVDRVVKLEHP